MSGASAAAELLKGYSAAGATAEETGAVADVLLHISAHPDCLLRTCVTGHLTGSAWVISPDRSRVLLTHHLKLDKWLQLGGHADGDPDLRAVAEREAREESGLTHIRLLSERLFDVDKHWIPARGQEPGHWHFDLRFAFEADPADPLVVSSESQSLAWVKLEDVAALNPEPSMTRMVRKSGALRR